MCQSAIDERPTEAIALLVMLTHDDGTLVPFGARRKSKAFSSSQLRARRDYCYDYFDNGGDRFFL